MRLLDAVGHFKRFRIRLIQHTHTRHKICLSYLEYNPHLLGYSKHDAWTYHPESQLNLAEIGASSADMPYMAKMLVQRIKQDKRINFKKSWKMVTINIGGNDICSFICTMDDPQSLPHKHKQRLIKTLRYLRDNLPR